MGVMHKLAGRRLFYANTHTRVFVSLTYCICVHITSPISSLSWQSHSNVIAKCSEFEPKKGKLQRGETFPRQLCWFISSFAFGSKTLSQKLQWGILPQISQLPFFLNLTKPSPSSLKGDMCTVNVLRVETNGSGHSVFEKDTLLSLLRLKGAEMGKVAGVFPSPTCAPTSQRKRHNPTVNLSPN